MYLAMKHILTDRHAHIFQTDVKQSLKFYCIYSEKKIISQRTRCCTVVYLTSVILSFLNHMGHDSSGMQ